MNAAIQTIQLAKTTRSGQFLTRELTDTPEEVESFRAELVSEGWEVVAVETWTAAQMAERAERQEARRWWREAA